MTRERVLVVEDDSDMGAELRDALAAQGYVVDLAPSGHEALALADAHPDLVLLDLGLPDTDGVTLAGQLRARLPEAMIVVLTARTDEIDVVSALDAGADDYLTKPFRLVELLARLRAHLRRQSTTDVVVVSAGALTVDLLQRRARIAGAELPLRPRELELLALLVSQAGRPLRRETIMKSVWDEHWFGSTKTLDVHVAALRRRLQEHDGAGGDIVTLRGFGYRYDAPPG